MVDFVGLSQESCVVVVVNSSPAEGCVPDVLLHEGLGPSTEGGEVAE